MWPPGARLVLIAFVLLVPLHRLSAVDGKHKVDYSDSLSRNGSTCPSPLVADSHPEKWFPYTDFCALPTTCSPQPIYTVQQQTSVAWFTVIFALTLCAIFAYTLYMMWPTRDLYFWLHLACVISFLGYVAVAIKPASCDASGSIWCVMLFAWRCHFELSALTFLSLITYEQMPRTRRFPRVGKGFLVASQCSIALLTLLFCIFGHVQVDTLLGECEVHSKLLLAAYLVPPVTMLVFCATSIVQRNQVSFCCV